MLTINEIVQATRGRLLREGKSLRVKNVSINSETIMPGAIFIAVKGQRLDGHCFVSKAVENGAVAVMTSSPVDVKPGIWVIQVKDTTKALGLLAAYYRLKFSIPVIAITGSAGKTSTKEWISSVLGSRYKVLKNLKSENNQFGVPLTLLKLRPAHEIAVLELGTNCPGDIEWLSRLVKPTVAVLTNIGESHLEKLKSKRGVFLEKKTILRHLDPAGTIILNGDDEYLQKIVPATKFQKILRYAIDHDCGDYQATRIRMNFKQGIDFQVKKHVVRLKTISCHNIYNALAAICCGRIFNVSYNNIHKVLYKQKNVDGRQKVASGCKIYLIDDSYNSNPVSFKSAIETLDRISSSRGAKKVLICGDMLELGEKAEILHEKMAELIAKTSIDYVLAKGEYCRFIVQKLETGLSKVKAVHFQEFEEIYKEIKRLLSAKDIVLVKGSRSMQMENVVQFIRKNY